VIGLETLLPVSVTDLAKGTSPPGDGEAPRPGAGESQPGAPEPEAFRGYSWGSAVHGALAAAATEPSSEELSVACHELLIETGRPLDENQQMAFKRCRSCWYIIEESRMAKEQK